MEEKLGERWIIDKMQITVTNKQMLDAILKISDISLGKSDCYIHDIKMNDTGGFNIEVYGAE
jgi:hypothetical protein